MSATVEVAQSLALHPNAESEILTPEAMEFLRSWTAYSNPEESIYSANAISVSPI